MLCGEWRQLSITIFKFHCIFNLDFFIMEAVILTKDFADVTLVAEDAYWITWCTYFTRLTCFCIPAPLQAGSWPFGPAWLCLSRPSGAQAVFCCMWRDVGKKRDRGGGGIPFYRVGIMSSIMSSTLSTISIWAFKPCFVACEGRWVKNGPCRAHRLKIHIKCSEFGWVKNVTDGRRNSVL